MITTDIGATKYTFGLKVGIVTLDPVVIWGQFQRNVTVQSVWDDTFDFTFNTKIVAINLFDSTFDYTFN